MRVTVIGGTEFIGRRLVERLVERGDEVLVVHRGRTEPADGVDCPHLHVDRRDFVTVAEQVRDFRPDAVVDTIALTRGDVEAVLPHLPAAQLVVLSSMDVYRAWEVFLARSDDAVPVPLDEDAPLRRGRFPYRGRIDELTDYDKLDVEPAYLRRGGTVLRLAMVYGPRDPQRREEIVLRRVRAGRARLPVGAGTTLLTRLHVDDAAGAVLAALARPDVATGEVFNIGETSTWTARGWIRQILAAAGQVAEGAAGAANEGPAGRVAEGAAGAAIELVRVPDDALPADLAITRSHAQHILADSRKARDLLGWRPAEPSSALADSVRWHLAHPPADASADFTSDDLALSRLATTAGPGSS